MTAVKLPRIDILHALRVSGMVKPGEFPLEVDYDLCDLIVEDITSITSLAKVFRERFTE